SYLTSVGLEAVMADAREIMVTDSQFGKALPLMKESTERARVEVLPYLDQGVVPVMQGFIGKSQDGLITTLGRGGSDYSATLVAAMLHAEAVEIWTDVDGVMTADPTIIRDVKRIRRITFQEAAELAYFGARVLHPATILPAIECGIPVYVLNTMHPEDSGTEILPITEDRSPGDSLVKSIVYKEGLTVITLKSTRMLMAYGFMASIFNVFNRYKTAVDLVSTSEVSVSITIDSTDHLEEILDELNRFSEVEVQHGKAIVCVVGEKIKKVHGMPAQIFNDLKDKEIHLISQGASEINISFVIDEAELDEIVRRLHDRFFTGPINEEVFAAASLG
ncbi:MAG TPA: aspartate kinase, partial [bacterium]|nr:aspartate kinase [bacterium]